MAAVLDSGRGSWRGYPSSPGGVLPGSGSPSPWGQEPASSRTSVTSNSSRRRGGPVDYNSLGHRRLEYETSSAGSVAASSQMGYPLHHPGDHLKAEQSSLQTTLSPGQLPASFSQELDKCCARLGERIPARFSSHRECVRFIDLDRSGMLTREKLDKFFHSFNENKRCADELFDFIDVDRRGAVPFHDFLQLIWRYTEPKVEKPRRYAPAPDTQSLGEKALQALAEKASAKYHHVRDLYRAMDMDSSGGLSRMEVQRFFRNSNLSSKMADEAYDHLNPHGVGEVPYPYFAHVMSTYIRPGTGQAEQKQLVPKEPPSWDQKVEQLMVRIGTRAEMKYRNVRTCFRAVDSDKDGSLDRDEVTMFFRDFGLDRAESDVLFDLMDTDHDNIINYNEFVEFLGPYIQPGYKKEGAATQKCMQVAPGKNGAFGTFDEPLELRELCTKNNRRGTKDNANELRRIIEAVGDKVMQRFRQPRDALKLLDKHRGRCLSCHDLEEFFPKVHLPAEMGQKFFYALDTEKAGEVPYYKVMNTLGPSVMPGYRPLTPNDD